MRLLAIALVLLALPMTAGAENATAPGAAPLAITVGAFCQPISVGEVPAPGTQAQKIDLLPGTPDIRWPTTVIPAKPGISFGIRSEAPDTHLYAPVLIELTHPPFLQSGTTYQSYLTELGGQGPSINAYSFDLLEEMVPGTWTFRAVHNGEVLYDVTFEVVDPALAPEVGRDCGKDYTS